MLKQATPEHTALLAALLNAQDMAQDVAQDAASAFAADALPAALAEDVFTLRMRVAFCCYGAQHPHCTFYFAMATENDDGAGETTAQKCPAPSEAVQAASAETADAYASLNPRQITGLLCVQGRSALYSGGLHDAQEMESFLHFLHIESFQSNSMLLPGWRPVPQYLMRLPAGPSPQLCVAQVERKPDLWQLAHSDTLERVDPDAWYADVCTRVNKGFATIYAVYARNEAGENGATQPMSTVSAFAVDARGVYVTAVATHPAARGCGYASTLLSALAADYADRDKWLLCRPPLRSFYEQLGFAFARPVCEYLAPNK